MDFAPITELILYLYIVPGETLYKSRYQISPDLICFFFKSYCKTHIDYYPKYIWKVVLVGVAIP